MSIIKRLGKRKLLLDTHVWIWLVLGNPAIKPALRKALKMASEEKRLLLSTISVWEVGMLTAKGRLILDLDPLDWVKEGLHDTRSKLTTITPRIAIQSSRLPGTFHGDPADRILVATARDQNAVLVTRDQKILKFGEDPFISVHSP